MLAIGNSQAEKEKEGQEEWKRKVSQYGGGRQCGDISRKKEFSNNPCWLMSEWIHSYLI